MEPMFSSQILLLKTSRDWCMWLTEFSFLQQLVMSFKLWKLVFFLLNKFILCFSQADPEQRFTTFIKALQATRLDKEITDYNSKSPDHQSRKFYNIPNICYTSAGPWTVFAPTNSAFMNLPMQELEELITNPKKLSKLVLNHLINRFT